MASDPPNDQTETDNHSSAPTLHATPKQAEQWVVPSAGSEETTAGEGKWKENHGNLLLAVFIVIVLMGFAIIWYQQTRFVPPSFPEGDLIQTNEVQQSVLEQNNAIVIRIAGAPNNRGSIKAAIHANSTTFQSENQALFAESLTIQNGEVLWLVPLDILPEQFAVAAYHDENEDQELTLNRFGIPTERYGFTREARGLTGPPRFQDAVISRPEAGGLVFVFLR